MCIRDSNQTSPVQVGTSTDWKSIYSGSSCSFAIKANGTLWAWGLNSTSGLYGNGTTTSSLSPLQIGTDHNWIKISCKTSHVLGLKTNGQLLAWGSNTVSYTHLELYKRQAYPSGIKGYYSI